MQLILVLDVMNGAIVRGQGGKRESYRPIATPLAKGAAPVAVARGLIRATGAAVVYVADLDAIMGGEAQVGVLMALTAALPDVRFWVDAGFRTIGEAEALTAAVGDARIVPVFGTETLDKTEADQLARIERPAVLSLDFGAEGYRGSRRILEDAARWPDDVIVMSLTAVGSDGGPDFARLEEIARRADGRRVHAAGGVRGETDLDALAAMGVAGALVASAIHDGRIARRG
ncbi:HisA/HisF-related TIM barrel protein [Fulvimarina sp. MAC3]|uniref:HisA/HisF-related TIM barrel protein n=1 Tax=Fulvimarina sp. MAC3 TaxID=3148887 RepID=UPI0031FCCF54